MKTCLHLWFYLTELFLESEIFQLQFVEQISTPFLCSRNLYFRKSCRLWDNVEKYGRARETTDDNIIRSMCFACWITKATNTLKFMWYLMLFHGNKNVLPLSSGYTIWEKPDDVVNPFSVQLCSLSLCWRPEQSSSKFLNTMERPFWLIYGLLLSEHVLKAFCKYRDKNNCKQCTYLK
jgi:hypothetical protein